MSKHEHYRYRWLVTLAISSLMIAAGIFLFARQSFACGCSCSCSCDSRGSWSGNNGGNQRGNYAGFRGVNTGGYRGPRQAGYASAPRHFNGGGNFGWRGQNYRGEHEYGRNDGYARGGWGEYSRERDYHDRRFETQVAGYRSDNFRRDRYGDYDDYDYDGGRRRLARGRY